ncbi:hypothetical protein GYMLUDRAFT_715012 [Collybiopsis luxurians FD-317 M1]|nr:hypothetical protein GYMLUDRAFT_715012 [Collybiopsis luxurians FD-317 M1]
MPAAHYYITCTSFSYPIPPYFRQTLHYPFVFVLCAAINHLRGRLYDTDCIMHSRFCISILSSLCIFVFVQWRYPLWLFLSFSLNLKLVVI